MKLILTCEHGGNNIPSKYESLFKTNSVLQTHRGYDIGALSLFRFLKPLSDWSIYSTTSRLLVELNRSLFHKQLFSEFTADLTPLEKHDILETYYVPYRAKVEEKIASIIASKETVLHLSIHSFTPSLNAIERHCDIGLLYDSTQKKEQLLCKKLKLKILQDNPNLNVRFNNPYLGKADGFTTYLRKRFPNYYLGIEIEVNQHFSTNNSMNSKLKNTLFGTIEHLKMNKEF